MGNLLETLRERHLLEDVTDPGLEEVLRKPITVYAGFDPSSPSLQAGNLATIMALKHFQRHGHRVIAVVGGATGLIGDPSGKSSDRSLLDKKEVRRNVEGIQENLSRFLDFQDSIAPAKVLNNADWLTNFGFVEFLRDVGRHFRVGTMLGRESVRARLASESGMSFTEFSYQILQAYDFLQLYDAERCVLQIGGSDQWGNITAGIDLIRKVRNGDAYGLTIPLVCDSSGQKFGKSEGNAVYLSADRTSYYDFYQFFIRTEDTDVIRLMKIFTTLSLTEIAGFDRMVTDAPDQRAAQKKLAEEVTRLVHGQNGLETAAQASSVLFGRSLDGLKADDLLKIFVDVPSFEMARSDVEGCTVVNLAAACQFCRSKSEARRLIESHGFYLNNCRMDDGDTRIRPSDIVDGRIVVLRSGKKKFYLVKVV